MSSADPPHSASEDVAAVGRIDSVPWILKTLCDFTGMGFAAVARVTEDSWTACAVEDRVNFGLRPGGELDVATTLCREVREARAPIAFDHASQDTVYCRHPTPKMYAFESYISVPIELPTGEYFGNLCALDPRPAAVTNDRVLAAFRHFARLVAFELDNERQMTDVRRRLLEEEAVGSRREQFIAVLAHDLRTPLGAIAACGQVLATTKGSESMAANLAKRIDNSVRRMAEMVDNILDMARARQGGGFKVTPAVIDDLAAALESVVDEARVAHPHRELVSAIRIDRPVTGDKGRLQQLLSNLVANALTHGSRHTPIEVSAATLDGQLQVEVHNEGRPIPRESMPGLFDAYSHAATNGRPHRGLGLGLYISRQIVEAHGGTLDVISTDAGGTTFTAKMPLKGPVDAASRF